MDGKQTVKGRADHGSSSRQRAAVKLSITLDKNERSETVRWFLMLWSRVGFLRRGLTPTGLNTDGKEPDSRLSLTI